MSLPFTVLPCWTCGTPTCTIHQHDQVVITLSRTGTTSTASGIFCHRDSSWNMAFLEHDQLNRSQRILHAAAIAVRQVAAYLANESAPRPAIKEIFLKVNVKAFVKWYEGEDRDSGVTPRTAALLRDLDDAAVLVGECGGHRPVVRFVKPSPFCGEQASGDLAMRVLHNQLSSKRILRPRFEIDYSC